MDSTRIVESDEKIRQAIEKLLKDTRRAPWSGVSNEKCQEGFARWASPRVNQNPEMFA
jgi:Txe/YoeB family toxin of Txe-Axe toxin-antitoxin module